MKIIKRIQQSKYFFAKENNNNWPGARGDLPSAAGCCLAQAPAVAAYLPATPGVAVRKNSTTYLLFNAFNIFNTGFLLQNLQHPGPQKPWHPGLKSTRGRLARTPVVAAHLAATPGVAVKLNSTTYLLFNVLNAFKSFNTRGLCSTPSTPGFCFKTSADPGCCRALGGNTGCRCREKFNNFCSTSSTPSNPSTPGIVL